MTPEGVAPAVRLVRGSEPVDPGLVPLGPAWPALSRARWTSTSMNREKSSAWSEASPNAYRVFGSWGMAAPSERGSPAAKFTLRLLSRTTAAP